MKDIVNVTRCKNCIFWEKEELAEKGKCKRIGNAINFVGPLDFCSKAKSIIEIKKEE